MKVGLTVNHWPRVNALFCIDVGHSYQAEHRAFDNQLAERNREGRPSPSTRGRFEHQ